MRSRIGVLCLLFVSLPLAVTGTAAATYDDGASDTTIRIGNISPMSGPLSVYKPLREAMTRCFDKINADGGINGRKIEYLTYDDAYNPAKTIEQARRLVESDRVLFLVGIVGTPGTMSSSTYLAQKKVPHLFAATPMSKFYNSTKFPWLTGWQPAAFEDGSTFAKYATSTLGSKRIGVLYQNDDLGRDFLEGVKSGLGEAGQSKIVTALSYETAEPTLTSQIALLKAADVDAVYLGASAKFAALAIRAIRELNWKPHIFVPYMSNSPELVLKLAGADASDRLFSTAFLMDPSDPKFSGTPDVTEYLAWMDKYNSGGDRNEFLNLMGWSVCQTTARILREAGDDLTRTNLMKVTEKLKGYRPPLAMPGVAFFTEPDKHPHIKCLRVQRYDSKRWVPDDTTNCSY